MFFDKTRKRKKVKCGRNFRFAESTVFTYVVYIRHVPHAMQGSSLVVMQGLMKDPGVNIAHMHDHALADDPWLTGDCQSNSDGQGYSDKGYLSIYAYL